MGYHRKFDLHSNDNKESQHIKAIQALLNFDPFSDFINWPYYILFMKDYSLKNPNVLFTLEVLGEYMSDISIQYYFEGKLQIAKAKFDKFDPAKLQ